MRDARPDEVDPSLPGAPAGPGYFHAIALDYDGTLATDDRAHPEALAAIAENRAQGRKVVLVTGRILSELRACFPDVDEHVDLIVAENGAVISSAGKARTVVAPVPSELDAALAGSGVSFRRGEVLLACSGADEAVISEHVRRLGLECQLIRNRGELMVLPTSVSKGTGLFCGLGDLGISVHNTIAVGDAENDHSLLETSELGVATGNAVDALKRRADVVLNEPNGLGVASFLRGATVAGRRKVHPHRWQVRLGVAADGSEVCIPASQLNVLITGIPRRGKSYVAGLIGEQLIGLGYSVVVIDPEGDHVDLGRLRGGLVAGGDVPLPSPARLVDLIGHRFGSVVVDLSATAESDRERYLRAAPAEIEAYRDLTGLPQWVIVDEAQVPLGREGQARTLFQPAATGYCLVTHRPDDLCPEALLAVDVMIVLPGEAGTDVPSDLVAAGGGLSRSAARALVASAGTGQAVLLRRDQPGTGVVFTVAERQTAHLRHWHKYSVGKLAPERRFFFRSSTTGLTGATAGNIAELEQGLRRAAGEVIAHHCRGGDLSRWVDEVLGDPPLARAMAAIERDAGRSDGAGDTARRWLVEAIRHRHSG